MLLDPVPTPSDPLLTFGALLMTGAVSFLGWQVKRLVSRVDRSTEQLIELRTVLGATGADGLQSRMSKVERDVADLWDARSSDQQALAGWKGHVDAVLLGRLHVHKRQEDQ